MTTQRMIPAQEVEIWITKNSAAAPQKGETTGQMSVRVNGAPRLAAPIEVRVPHERILEEYRGLDTLRRKSPWMSYDSQDYLNKERALGALLGDCLLSGIGPVLEACLQNVGETEYVRLVVCFEDRDLERLPWELLLWQRGPRDEAIWLGRDERFSIARLVSPEQPRALRRFARHGKPITVLNILADGGLDSSYQQTRAWLEWMEDRQPGLHTVSRPARELPGYRRAMRMLQEDDRFQVIQWLSHGGDLVTTAQMRDGDDLESALGAPEVVEHAGTAFLWLLLVCDAAGSDAEGRDGQSSMHAEFIRQGAPAIVGPYSAFDPKGHERQIAILYGALARRWPLDAAVQRMRAAQHKDEVANAPAKPPWLWSKPVLSVASTWHLGGALLRDPYVAAEAANDSGWLDRWLGLYELKKELNKKLAKAQAACQPSPEAMPGTDKSLLEPLVKFAPDAGVESAATGGTEAARAAYAAGAVPGGAATDDSYLALLDELMARQLIPDL